MPKNKLYDGVKITKLAPAMNYGMRKDKPVTASKTEGSYSGSRTPYARVSKKKGGSVGGKKKNAKSKCSSNRLY